MRFENFVLLFLTKFFNQSFLRMTHVLWIYTVTSKDLGVFDGGISLSDTQLAPQSLSEREP